MVGDSEDDENTNDFITDLGSSNNDGITSSNMITINDLKADETWQYSIDSGVNHHTIYPTRSKPFCIHFCTKHFCKSIVKTYTFRTFMYSSVTNR
jgi:hypothetical protein